MSTNLVEAYNTEVHFWSLSLFDIEYESPQDTKPC